MVAGCDPVIRPYADLQVVDVDCPDCGGLATFGIALTVQERARAFGLLGRDLLMRVQATCLWDCECDEY